MLTDEDRYGQRDDTRCSSCGCSWEEHNHPAYGGGCLTCGLDCDGWPES